MGEGKDIEGARKDAGEPGADQGTSPPRWQARQGAALIATTLVLAVGVVCLVNGARRIGQPFPGFLVAGNGIVLSIGLSGWPLDNAERIHFSKVIAVAGAPVADGTAVAAQLAALAPDTPVTYRFRKGAEVFTAVIGVQTFSAGDFVALYGTYFLTGLCFALAGLWAARQRPQPAPAAAAFFFLCMMVALVLLTGADVYGPYWFSPLYFTAQALVPATIFHFASSYPEPLGAGSRWRRVALAALYAAMLGLAAALNLVVDEPSLFLPLVYSLYLLLANAFLLSLTRLAIALWTVTEPQLRRSVRRALAALLLSATVPAAIFVIYPTLTQPISPILLVVPLALFAPMTASALRLAGGARAEHAAPGAPGTSVRLRLSLLFLGAVETAFLAGVAMFWLASSWNQLLDDFALTQRQRALVEHALSEPDRLWLEDLREIDALVQGPVEQKLIIEALDTLTRQDVAAARRAVMAIAATYDAQAARWEDRRWRLNQLGAALVIGLVLAGIVQAVGFMIAVRRWLIHPIERLTAATRVIATGDLGHRIALDGALEFASLGHSVNTMAASLAQIQRRIDSEQDARARAAGAARDAERRRLARELHDGTLQDLSALKLVLEGAARAPDSVNLLPTIDALIQVIVDLRRVVDDLGPPDLSHVPLVDAIAGYARAAAHAQSVEVRTELAADAPIAEWTSRDVYRIAQEALTNAVRHGAPEHLVVRLFVNGTATVLEIEDDGAGFDLGTAALGTGIRGMRERATAIGASLDIITAPGAGTTVRLTLPPSRT